MRYSGCFQLQGSVRTLWRKSPLSIVVAVLGVEGPEREQSQEMLMRLGEDGSVVEYLFNSLQGMHEQYIEEELQKNSLARDVQVQHVVAAAMPPAPRR